MAKALEVVLCNVSYTLQTTVTGEFDEVIETTIAALEDEGFGILSDIDMGGTLEGKLDVDFRNYRILGACNPPLAHEILTEQMEGGTLLPCSVAVYEDEDAITVAAVDPDDLLGLTDSGTINSVGEEISERFERAMQTVAADFESAD